MGARDNHYVNRFTSNAIDTTNSHLVASKASPLDLSSFGSTISSSKNSVVKIEGYYGCKDILWGTGFIVGPDLVATNAHTIAGTNSPFVFDGNGKHIGVPVVFDPELDFAVLRVSGLTGQPLPLNISNPEISILGSHIGDQDVALGYPNAGDFIATLATIRDEQSTTESDIYGNPVDDVDLLYLNTKVVPGNSGSPLLQQNGQVAGIVFGMSPTDKNTGYALPTNAFLGELMRASSLYEPVSTQACIAAAEE